MGRAPCCDKATVKKGPWSPEEDAKLKAYIDDNGTGGNWIALPQKIGLKRCGKSCRLRWLNYLRPNIKHGDFTEEEEHIICSLYISIGSRWSIIAAQLPGRTDNDIKNYWNTKLKKRLLGGRRKGRGTHHRPQSDATNAETDGGANNDGEERSLSASAMERIQLCMQLQEMQNPLGISSHQYNPLQQQMWPNNHHQVPTQSNSSGSSSLNVTVAAEQGQSSSMNDQCNGFRQLETAAVDDGLASPSSPKNSNVVTIEAELQELLYGTTSTTTTDSVAVSQQGGADWWSYDQDRSAVNCWDFTPETSSVFQDYTSVYDI